MADFLLEIGLEEVPDRMIAGAEAELGRRVSDLLTRERLLGACGQTNHVLHAAAAGRAGGGRAGAAGRHRGEVNGAVVEGGVQRWRADGCGGSLCKKAGVAVTALEKVTNAKGEYVGATVKRLGREAAELLAAELPKEVLEHLLGQEHVLARRQAGAFCKAGALGGGAARFCCCSAGDCRDCGR